MAQLTVGDLVDRLLAGVSPDAPVSIEGCDCSGPADGIEVQLDGSVLITRALGS